MRPSAVIVVESSPPDPAVTLLRAAWYAREAAAVIDRQAATIRRLRVAVAVLLALLVLS